MSRSATAGRTTSVCIKTSQGNIGKLVYRGRENGDVVDENTGLNGPLFILDYMVWIL